MHFAPGISRSHGAALYFSGFLVAVLMPWINFAQPYILTEHLRLPTAGQGAFSGDLAFWTEVVLIVLAGICGTLSDRVGPRLVMALGLGVVATSFVFYPLATAPQELLAFRLVFAVGAAAVSTVFVALQTEYPVESDRAKLVAVMSVFSILGVFVIIAVLARLPGWFRASGADSVAAGRYAWWIVAAIAVAGAFVVARGLAPKASTSAATDGFVAQLHTGLALAAGNPRIALSCAAGCVGRADLVVVTVFLSLWVTQAGLALKLTAAEALAQAATLFGVIQLAALGAAPVLGWLFDRIDRVAALAIATGIAAAGYAAMGFAADPLASSAILPAAVLGVGQVAAIMAATALVGQESPRERSGALAGVFTLSGALGILVATKLGGWLFDAWMPGAPFVVVGAANAVVALLALAVLVRTDRVRQ